MFFCLPVTSERNMNSMHISTKSTSAPQKLHGTALVAVCGLKMRHSHLNFWHVHSSSRLLPLCHYTARQGIS